MGSIYLFAFLIPSFKSLFGIWVLLFILEILIRRIPIKKSYISSQLVWKNPGIWLILFYLMHIVGLFYTDNMQFATADLGMKASFLLIPFVFLLFPIQIDWKLFIRCFLIGAFVSIVLNFSLSLRDFLDGGTYKSFLDTNSSSFMHRGYWAVYLSIAYYFILKIAMQINKKGHLFFCLLGALVLLLTVVITGAKIGMFLVLLISLWAGVSLFIRVKKRWFSLLFVAVFIGGFAGAFVLFPNALQRIKDMINDSNQSIEQLDKVKITSTGARIMLWDSATELISENFWWGVGTGDLKDELQKRNYEKGYIGVAEQNFNSHNQFFNTHLALGVFGVFFLWMTFITNVIRNPLNKQTSWRIMLTLLLCLALIPESMLETQAGIIPFAFLLSAIHLPHQELLTLNSPKIL